MNELTYIGLFVGAVLIVLGGAGVFKWNQLSTALYAFPRHRASAILLTLVNVVWVAVLLYHTPLGRFEVLKPLLFVLAPVTFWAVTKYMDELLAPRMLGGLLLLAAVPVLDAARWHESGWRLVLTVLAYLWIVWSIFLVLSPYRFRHTVERVGRDPYRKPVFTVLLGTGLLLLFLSATAY